MDAQQLILGQELLRTMSLMSINLIYAVISIMVGISAMSYAYKLFDKLIPGETGQKLIENPVALGVAVAGIMIGVGLLCGLIIGLSIN